MGCTGYTAKLYEKGQSFNEFVWTCARAFGALAMMRDAAPDAPIDFSTAGDSYHAQRLKEAQAEVEKWSKADMGSLKLQKQITAEYKRALDDFYERQVVEQLQYDRMRAMREQVLAWTPPTADHSNLKEFMLEQIDQTLKWPPLYAPEKAPRKPSTEAYIARHLMWAESDVAYHSKALIEETKRNEGRLNWLKDLHESVPYPGATK